MAYIPPHLRQSNPNPTPSSPASGSSSKNKTLNYKSSHSNPNPRTPYTPYAAPSQKAIYGPHAISRWYSTSPQTENLSLVPYNCETIEINNGARPLTLTVSKEAIQSKEEERKDLNRIVEKVTRDLVETSRYAREERENNEEREKEDNLVELSVVSRVGKILFEGNSSEHIDSIISAAKNEENWDKQIRKSFNTNMSHEYITNIEEFLVEKSSGFKFESSKEHFHIKVFDKNQPDTTLSCKCIVSPDGNLELYKVELNQLRYMVTDISCLQKDFDLRIMLSTKKIFKNLDADVANGIDKLIKSAIINPKVKGGLKWPLGKESFSQRFFVVGVWHIKYKIFSREEIRVKVREADRFYLNTSSGETSNEVTIKLHGVSELLNEDNIVKNNIVDMIGEAVEFIWGNFLSNKLLLT